MTLLRIPDSGLVKRLLAGAEGRAAEGRIREGFVLLRWASRLAPRDDLPGVLLTYHRLRAAGQSPVADADVRAGLQRGVRRLDPGRVPHRGGVMADALGFPVPRFPTRAPDLDRTAFVPAPQQTENIRPAAPPVALARRRPADRFAPALAAVCITAAAFVLGPTGPHNDTEWIRGVPADDSAELDAALRAGDASPALALTRGGADQALRLLLIRGRAAIAIGDTAGGTSALQTAVEHPLADAARAWEAAELLAGIPGEETAAATAYLRAFSLGLAPEKWAVVAQALDRAGRHDQATRVRVLIRASALPAGH